MVMLLELVLDVRHKGFVSENVKSQFYGVVVQVVLGTYCAERAKFIILFVSELAFGVPLNG